MTQFKWNDRYRTGLILIDEQHQKLFELINNLNLAIYAENGKELLDNVLKELLEYVFHHFKVEEEFLSKNKYPDFRLHRTEHDSLTKNLLELRGKYKTGNRSIASELSNFLKSWLIIHILQSDMKFAKYVKVINKSHNQIGIQC